MWGWWERFEGRERNGSRGSGGNGLGNGGWGMGGTHRLTPSADSEISMDDGALNDDFSEQSRSWDDSGTMISDT